MIRPRKKVIERVWHIVYAHTLQFNAVGLEILFYLPDEIRISIVGGRTVGKGKDQFYQTIRTPLLQLFRSGNARQGSKFSARSLGYDFGMV